ncbi:hypothetical protein [Rhizobium mesoamericanum]|nr:hypothetical protein [Rhizobium mesoamericanum]
MTDILSWLSASLAYLITVSILWHQDEIAALANERKAKEEGRI